MTPLRAQTQVVGGGDGDVVQCENVTKLFGGVQALRSVSLSMKAGEVLCLVGDNGAGKSTLSKIIAGQLRPDAGEISIGGVKQPRLTPRRALELGISVVPQTLSLCDNLNASQNVMLGNEEVWLRIGPFRFVDGRRNRAEALTRLEGVISLHRLDVTIPVRRLSGGQRQAIAIVRAMVRGTKAIIFDEPTAALGVRQTEATLDLVRQVAARGIAVLAISHTLPDVMAIANRIVALRHGEVIMDKPIEATDEDEIAAAMALRTTR
jgi:ABC-type sugar transport system ATPase subunit